MEDLVPPGPSCNDSCPIQGFLSCRGHADQGQAGKETASWGLESPEDVRCLGRWSRGSSLLPVQSWEESRAGHLIPDPEAVSASLILAPGSWGANTLGSNEPPLSSLPLPRLPPDAL